MTAAFAQKMQKTVSFVEQIGEFIENNWWIACFYLLLRNKKTNYSVNMKKIILLLTMLVGVLTAQAGDYVYLTFETTDGAKTSVDVSSLPVTINLDKSTLTIGNQTFTLTDLSKMYFSTSDETTTTGIEGIGQLDHLQLDEVAEIYDLSGKKIVNKKSSKGQLPRGVYIVKTKGRTFKMVVK